MVASLNTMYHAMIILTNEPVFKNTVEAQQQRAKTKEVVIKTFICSDFCCTYPYWQSFPHKILL